MRRATTFAIAAIALLCTAATQPPVTFVTTILQLIRLTRNDAGHPTGRRVDHEDCYQNLVVYANAHRKLHRLKDYFDEHSDARS